ncbi:MAG: sugar nucleotide-binding protein [Fimbriimonadaceae bacterium]
MKVAVMGSTGMLGTMCCRVLAEGGHEVVATVRNPHYGEALQESLGIETVGRLDVLAEDVQSQLSALPEIDAAVNCIGLIKQHMNDADPASTWRALQINSVFPYHLDEFAAKRGIPVVQIATDCVFSGLKGQSTELDPHDAHDVYGKTKSLGEAPRTAIRHLRCSIIGLEAKSSASLIGWFLSTPAGGQVNGFTNHLWNGVTTLHFARIAMAALENQTSLPPLQHVVAGDTLSKYDMLHCFAEAFDRKDIVIQASETPASVDRTLGTVRPEVNEELWQCAGYAAPPGVTQMIRELAEYGDAVRL